MDASAHVGGICRIRALQSDRRKRGKAAVETNTVSDSIFQSKVNHAGTGNCIHLEQFFPERIKALVVFSVCFS